MKLEELMNAAFDETWFCVVTPDGEEHMFWNADYLGWHPDVMPELEPLLDREFDEFELSTRKDPEAEDVFNADDVPVILVGLLMTDEELEERRKQAQKEDENDRKTIKTKKGKTCNPRKKTRKAPGKHPRKQEKCAGKCSRKCGARGRSRD